MEKFHTHLGIDADGESVGVSLEERLRHTAAFGATGVGKSTLFLNLIAQSMAHGDGLLLLDPHGDLAEDTLGLVPVSRNNQVCYFNLGDLAHPVALNILEDVSPDDRATHAENIVSAMRAIWKDSWGDRLERILRHAITALIETPGASLVLLPRLLTDEDFRRRIVPRLSNPITRSFFEKQFDVWRDQFRDEVIVSTLNRIEAFSTTPAVRNVIGQSRSTLHFEHALERSRIVIVNLAIGTIGETPAYLMGSLILARVLAAGMARTKLDRAARSPFHLYIDEAQYMAGNVIRPLITGGRKFGLSVTLASQGLAELDDRTRATIRNSVHTLFAFRLGDEDAETLAPEFDRAHQTFNPFVLRQLEIGHAMLRIPGRYGEKVITAPPPELSGRLEVVRKQSRIHYGVDRSEVEDKIIRALKLHHH